jgi:excinuclease ABC subunit B
MLVTYPHSPYQLHKPFEPAGDQPEAIAQLVEGSTTASRSRRCSA